MIFGYQNILSLVLFLFLYLFSGTRSLITVHQPPLLTAALGHNVTMPCQLSLSDNEKFRTTPVLYWMYNSKLHLLFGSDSEYKERHEGRVHILDNNKSSSNKSILLKYVKWDDSGKYLCKLSFTTETNSFREKGNETLLIVYGKYKDFS